MSKHHDNSIEYTGPDRRKAGIDRWKHRRRMAYASIVGGMTYPLLVWASDSALLADMAGPFYVFVGIAIGAYVGFATVDDKWQSDK